MNVHYTDKYLLNPTHRVSITVVGAGGTGSQVISSLARIDHALYKLGHPGIHVTLYDDDIVTDANIGRQLYCVDEIGINKADALISRINAFYGIDWQSERSKYPQESSIRSNITISCVDNIKSRLKIGEFLRRKVNFVDQYQKTIYWMDFGNSVDTGQAILGTINETDQPKSKKYQTVGHLQSVDEMFDLKQVKDAWSGPSCSLAEALRKQGLFVNSTLAQLGCGLLWQLFSKGMIRCHGFYMNTATLQVSPININE